MKRERKVHLFTDCLGLHYNRREDGIFTSDIKETTCGHCKGRLLEHIRALDWSNLPRHLERGLFELYNDAGVWME
jgi:hypothetical protein